MLVHLDAQMSHDDKREEYMYIYLMTEEKRKRMHRKKEDGLEV